MIEELSTSKQTYEPRSADSRNSYITESLEFASNFEITISHVMDLSIAKMISGELIGETSEIVNSWKSFKHIVEQDSTQDLAFTHKSHKNNYLKALNRKLSAKKSKHKTMCK
jgi:phosphoribosyl 1,2-cyclic phosphodiesterase